MEENDFISAHPIGLCHFLQKCGTRFVSQACFDLFEQW